MTRNGKRLTVLAVIAGIVGLGFFAGPLVLDAFLELHGL